MSMLWDNWHSDAKHPLRALYIYLLTLYLMEIQGSFIQKKILLTPATKLKGEKRVTELCSNYAIARVVVVYGAALPGQHGNILQLVANRLRNNEEIRVVSDQWRTPTYVGDVSQGIEKLINHPNNGIYHICGSECLTIADIAYRVADTLNLDYSLILPVTTKQMGETTPRPRFSGLSIEKARRELGYQPHTLEEGIKLMFNL